MDSVKVFLVILGSGIGGLFRYGLSTIIYDNVRRPTFPWANLIINVSGSFLVGLLAELFETRFLVSPNIRVALLTGLLGGYTTFSSFSLETLSLFRDGEFWRALLNAFGSVVLGLGAAWLGVKLSQAF
jgi:fluoride exporter